ncbi:MAG: M20/M25/M40 family metallo-hydrolase, partial [Bacilli bacterium]|nr:M20/M25/M40 family metallo-hydrolase [Bacilli bacterium]
MDFKKITNPYQDELLKSVDRFVAIPGVYDQKTVSKDKPYGKYVYEVLNEFAKFGKKNGFKVEHNPRYVELSYGNKGPIIGIYGHLDVVPAIDQKIFKLRKEKDKIFGRGVIDDKGPLLAATYAAIALKNLGLIKNVQLKIFAGGDEERGSSCLASYAKTHQAPKYGFTPDSDFPVVYGEKGLTGVTISKNIKFKNIISIKGGVVSNSVIGEATFKVSNINEIKNKLKFPHKIKGNEITYLGVGAHAS